MTKAAFVTAIGTECGKTFVSAAILRHLTALGSPVAALKPLMSGYDPADLEASDAGRLLAAMGRPATPEAVTSVCWRSFPDWLAPNVAARKHGVALAWNELLTFVQDRIAAAAGPVLVEGAGGVMSPLTDTHTNLDLITTLRLPALLVAANYLGAVSHTLTALDVMDRRNVEVRAIIVSQPLPNAGHAAPMVEELARWTGLPVITAGYTPADDVAPAWAADLAGRLFPGAA